MNEHKTKARIEHGETIVEITGDGGSMESLMDVIRMAVKGLGYSDVIVDRYMPDCGPVKYDDLRHG